MAGKYSKALEEIFDICVARNDFAIHNDLVKDVSRKLGAGNPFQVTKIDQLSKLPQKLIDNDYIVIHLGGGNHRFIKGINKIFNEFEPIQETIDWEYKKSLLNFYNSSESNVLSVANNQRILHHFLLGKDKDLCDVDIVKRPKTYFPHRTRTNLEYFFGKDLKVELQDIQIEIDLTIEYQGTIGIFEAKNGKPKNFNIYQLYHPFLYYYNAQKHPELLDKINKIVCVYLVFEKGKQKENSNDKIKLWAYTFENPFDITTIKLVKSTIYNLERI